jgi:hypothetical protein
LKEEFEVANKKNKSMEESHFREIGSLKLSYKEKSQNLENSLSGNQKEVAHRKELEFKLLERENELDNVRHEY